jgi:hypothetical protein
VIDFYKYAKDFGELLEKRTGKKYRIEIKFAVANYYLEDRCHIHLWSPEDEDIAFHIHDYELAYPSMQMNDYTPMSIVDLDKDVDLVLNTLRKLIECHIRLITMDYEKEMMKIETDLQLLS